jgi:hypothetical protein
MLQAQHGAQQSTAAVQAYFDKQKKPIS